MTHRPSDRPFAWWSTSPLRSFGKAPAAPIAPPQSRPFSRPNALPQPGSGSSLKTAEILPFTGSNTPYESHE